MTKTAMFVLLALSLCGFSSCGNTGSAVYPGYLGAQQGYHPPPYRAPLTTRCTRLGIDGEQLLCQTY